MSGQTASNPRARAKVPNEDVAAALERIADLLEAQKANRFRVRAYRHAATTVDRLDEELAEIDATDGLPGLERLPGVGKSIAATIHELLTAGRSAMLDRLEGQVSPEDLIASVPGVGEKLAQRIHVELGIETLEDLEVAAHDGRLEGLKGIGPGKARVLREVLDGILRRSARRHARHPSVSSHSTSARYSRPSVSEILSVDHEYRREARAGRLRKIAPRRFNPSGDAWLPILHTERGDRHYSALFSNTHRAHELGKTDDWVVIFYELDGHEDQCTVVTEHEGRLRGKRVVRGLEAECASYYDGMPANGD